MPPRYAYWTILIGDEPTAFRSGSQEDLLPTFNRLKEKQPSARMMWFQNGKLWESRLAAQEAMRARGEIGRSRDVRQRPALGERRPAAPVGRREWKGARPSERAPGARERREERDPSGKLDWKPKGENVGPPFKGGRGERSESAKSRNRSEKLEWRPKGAGTSSPQALKPSGPGKRKWVPKAEYKKSQGIEAKKDKNWRPGGEHKDPRQKYKDAKKAKWGRFKQTVRKRWESKPGKKNGK